MVKTSDILKMGILVAHEAPMEALVLAQMLGSAGYTGVDSTSDLLDVPALQLANHYGLILLDLESPGQGGFQVMEDLGKLGLGQAPPVLGIGAGPEGRKRALEAGAAEFISKPFDRIGVLSRTRDLLKAGLTRLDTSDTGRLFRLIAAQFPVALCVREFPGKRIAYVNAAWGALTGRRIAAGDPGEGVFLCIHPDDLATVRAQTDQGAGGVADLRCRALRPDARVQPVRLRTFPLKDAKETPLYVVWLMEESAPARR
jgi:CheY-like chemotaxis protein